MKPGKEIFDKMEAGLSEYLTNQNFKVSETKYHPEAFGSRYTVWKNEEELEVVRLVWDGKESWFVVEESPYNLGSETYGWADIIVVPFDKSIEDESYYNEIIGEIVNEIS